MSVVGLLLIGAIMGTLGTLSWTQRPSTRVVTGVVVAIDDTGAAIRVAAAGDLSRDLFGGRGIGVVGVLWREAVPEEEPVQQWRRTASDSGHPTCLSPEQIPRGVTLGMVTDPGGAGRPATEVVAWLECAPFGASPSDGDPSEEEGAEQPEGSG
jgi:hypothetical protein